MGFDKNFKSVLRFMVVSDVHYKDEHSVERDRMELAIKTANELSEKEEYSKLDALYVVGDFATSGTRTQMLAFKDTLDKNLKAETIANLSMASHEYHGEGEAAALEKFAEIFAQEPDTHRVINGFHFISVTCTNGCHFDEAKQKWVSKELEIAAKDAPNKPIFFFQHPHITDTVYGSIYWGEDELIPTLISYPQIINFSGHSHAPINDPRSIHQKHFTSLGTGTLSYFELDEFDKHYGTCPPGKEKAAQMLIVEADAENRVRIYPYDLITSNFFPFVWKIDSAWDVDSFEYTRKKRFATEKAPYFREDAKLRIVDVKEDGFTVDFDQATADEEYVNDYNIILKNADGVIVRKTSVWSEYYFYEMPETLRVTLDALEKGEYYVEIFANGFWENKCKTPLRSEIIKL